MLRILNAGFSRLTDEEFVAKAAAIIAALTGNANFPTTSPTLLVVQSALEALTNAMALQRGQARDAAVAAARSTLEDALQDVATNLELVPDVTAAMLATSGFDLRKARVQTDEPPPIPQNVRLRATGVTGEVQVLFDASERAIAYQVQTTDEPGGTWTDHDPFSSSRRVVLHGLPRAKDVWVRVRALGPNNTRSGWSDPATILVS